MSVRPSMNCDETKRPAEINVASQKTYSLSATSRRLVDAAFTLKFEILRKVLCCQLYILHSGFSTYELMENLIASFSTRSATNRCMASKFVYCLLSDFDENMKEMHKFVFILVLCSSM